MAKTLLFNPRMARAWARGEKSQTRRALSLKLQDNYLWCRIGTEDEWIGWYSDGADGQMPPIVIEELQEQYNAFTQKQYRIGDGVKCPYGKTGDMLALLTTWATDKKYDNLPPSKFPDDVEIWSYFDGAVKPSRFGKKRTGRFLPNKFRARMPRAKITGIRIERITEISDDDIWNEGINTVGHLPLPSDMTENDARRSDFYELFDGINKGKGISTKLNSWVWVLGLKKIPLATERGCDS